MGSGEVKERARCLEKTSLRLWYAFGTVKMSTVSPRVPGRTMRNGDGQEETALASAPACADEFSLLAMWGSQRCSGPFWFVITMKSLNPSGFPERDFMIFMI